MTTCHFNCVAAIDSIPPGELQSARRLYENLDDVRARNQETPGVRYTRAATTDAVIAELAILAATGALGQPLGIVNTPGIGTFTGASLDHYGTWPFPAPRT